MEVQIEAVTEQEIIFECDVDLIREMKGRDIPNESNENCDAETKEGLQSEVE